MNTFLKQVVVLFLITLLNAWSVVALAKSPVWKVSKGDDFLYLGGTIHLLSKRDYPLPSAFETAYQDTDDVVFETDITALSAPEIQGQALKAMSYQDGRRLSTVLDRDIYSQLDTLLKSKGLPIAALDGFTPAGVMMTLTQLELQKLGLVGGDGVDVHFGQRAINDKKESIFLESVEEQLSFIESLNKLDPNLVIRSGINDLQQLETIWAELLSAWKSGDIEQLERIGIDEMKRDFPRMYQIMLVSRNDNWLQQVETMMRSEDKEFILVGALHMAGDDGLIKRLSQAGYLVEQLD